MPYGWWPCSIWESFWSGGTDEQQVPRREASPTGDVRRSEHHSTAARRVAGRHHRSLPVRRGTDHVVAAELVSFDHARHDGWVYAGHRTGQRLVLINRTPVR